MDRSEAIPAALPDVTREAGLEQVFRTQYHRLVPLLVRITGDKTLAEELASEALYRLSSRPGLLGAADSVEAWLYRTATNLALDALRGRTRRQRYENAAGAETLRTAAPANPLEDLLSRERQQAVRTVLATIKERSARTLLLRHTGFSYSEIAAILEVPAAAIPSIVMRATEEFRKEFQKTYRSSL